MSNDGLSFDEVVSSFTKLKDGTWAVKTPVLLKSGDSIDVTKANGQVVWVKVAKRISDGDEYSIWTVQK